jgi:hypothetical protein
MLPAARTQVTPTVAGMTASEKIAEALRRSLPLLLADARAEVEKLLEPATLAILAGVLVVWAGSHFFGVGEVVDVVLLAVGVAFSEWLRGRPGTSWSRSRLRPSMSVVRITIARPIASRAVSIIGINAVMAVLFHQTARRCRLVPAGHRGQADRRWSATTQGNESRS